MKAGFALLIGVAIGASLGLMFAPQSGEETQELLGRKAQDSLDGIVSAGKKVSEAAKSAASKGRDQFNQVVGMGKETYEAATA